MKPSNPILETQSVRNHVYPLSIDTYHVLGDLGRVDRNVELLRGIVVEKMSKSPIHSFVCQRLVDWFRSMTSKTGGVTIRQEQPLTLSDSEPEPDIAIVAGGAEDYAISHPETAHLVVEVAISTIEVDREKAPIYAEAGIPEYWLIRPADKEIDIYSIPEKGVYKGEETIGIGSNLTTVLFSDFRLPLADLFDLPAGQKS